MSGSCARWCRCEGRTGLPRLRARHVRGRREGGLVYPRHDREQFLADEKTQYAVVRALEVIGEASKKVPSEFKGKHPNIPWREISGMRDKLVHDYFGVNVAVVWRTATEGSPKIATAPKGILKN